MQPPPPTYNEHGQMLMDVSKYVRWYSYYTGVYDEGDDFGFPIVNFSWFSGYAPLLPSLGIDISQLIRFARCCSNVLDFQ